MTTAALVRPLFDGPLDIIGDVHGEIDALTALMNRLGYAADGTHPEGQRLVFVGDLLDRGPDSPAVVELVRRLVETDRAQAVLGNHEFNILIGSHKSDNTWFFHHATADRPEVQADEPTREMILRFLRALPLALERSDLRIVHACWDAGMIERARRAGDAAELYREARTDIDQDQARRGEHDPAVLKLARQNLNPVKLLTSGPEIKADKPFEANGQIRHERRVAWWDSYADRQLCVFGHYWRMQLPGEVDGDHLFTDIPLNATLGRGKAMCIDYSVGKRWRERGPASASVFHTRLAALRCPERLLVFEDGDKLPLLDL